FGFRYLWGASWKRQNYDLHKVVGFYSSAIVALVALSGTYFSFPSVYQRVTEKLTGTKVTVGAPRAHSQWQQRTIPMEEFIRIAERVQPGATAVQFAIPQKAGDPVTVRTKEARDWHRVGLNYVYLEAS